jgi:uncharacterized damage-inducible protein DinB
MRHTIGMLALLAVAFVPAAAQAQEMEHKEGMDHMQHHGAGIAAVQPQYDQVKGWMIATAEMMPEENYGYRPTEAVRSFGELMGHVANAGYMFCSAVLGEDSPNATNIEKTVTSKAGLVEAVKTMFAYCDKAYQIDEMKAMEEVTFFGRQGSRLWVLVFNSTHNFEHYGNLVTYLRMNGMTPPSSQRG